MKAARRIPTATGVNFLYRYAWIEREEKLFRVISWWQPESTSVAIDLLEKAYSSVRWLDPSGRQQLSAQLAKLDPGNAVGGDFAMRNRTFFDFSGGFVLKLPDEVFESKTAVTLPPEKQNLRLELTNLGTDTYVGVQIGSVDSGQHGSHHRSITSEFDVTKNETLRFNNEEFLVSHYKSQKEGIDFSHAFASNISGERLCEFWLTRVGSDQSILEEELNGLLPGFERPEKMQITTRKVGQIVDHRLGYKIEIPEGWTAQEMPLGDMASMGSGWALEHEDSVFCVIAMCSPFGIDLDLAVQGVLQNIGIQFDGSTEENSKSTLGGLPAERKFIKGKMERTATAIHVLTTRRAHSGYVFYLLDRLGSRSIAEVEELAASLEFLD